MLAVLTVPAFASIDGPTFDGGSEEEPPRDAKIYVREVERPLLESGEIGAFPLVLGTRDTYDAFDVRMRISGTGDYADMFSVDTPTGWYEIPVIQDNAKINPTINVSGSVPSGRYTLKVSFTYLDGNDNVFTTEDTFQVSVGGKSNQYAYIQSASFEDEEIGKENKSILNVNFHNPYGLNIFDMRVSLNLEQSKGFTLYENFLPAEIEVLETGQSATIPFSVYLGSEVSTGNYPITFDVSYKDAFGKRFAYTETIYTQVKRSPDAGGDGKGGQPRIIVSNYSTDTETINAGQSFTLDFTLQNTSSETAVSNIKVVLGSVTSGSTGGSGSSSSGEVFFPAAGSNSFFIERISPKGSATQQIELMSRQDIEPGVYAVLLKIDYENDSGTAFASEEQIAFAVNQEQRLDIQGMNLPTDGQSGMPLPLSFQYINKGKSTIYNFSVAIEGDFTLDGGDTYIGNLSAGYNDYFDGSLIPNGEGELKGAVVLKYEDSQGQEKEERTEFTANIMPMDMGVFEPGIDSGMMPGMPGMPEAKAGFPLWGWIVIGVVVLGGAGAGVFLFLKKRKANKKAAVNDEED